MLAVVSVVSALVVESVVLALACGVGGGRLLVSVAVNRSRSAARRTAAALGRSPGVGAARSGIRRVADLVARVTLVAAAAREHEGEGRHKPSGRIEGSRIGCRLAG